LGWIGLPGIQQAGAAPHRLDLADYPRPTADNGWGVHWAPTLLTQSPQNVDRYLAEVDALNLRWLTLMQPDQAGLEHQYLLSQLAARGIEPVLRVQKSYNDPYQQLATLVKAGRTAGVDYYELYSNVNVAGLEGGWRSGQAIDIKLIAQRWVDAARTVRAGGGYPGLPSLSPNGAIVDTEFLRRFLGEVAALNALDTLDGAWMPIQNYMSNRPLDDPDGFRRFERYHQIVQEVSGRTLPILSTEGGALVGDHADPRYPALTEAGVAEQTAAAFQYMAADAPDYFFAFMPWLLVNAAAGGYANAWEAHAWFRADGTTQPVVDAIQSLSPNGDRPVQPTVPPTNLQYAQQPTAVPTIEAQAVALARRSVDAAPVEPATPQTTAPQTTAPQTTAPQTTAPQTTAPQTTAPQTTAPQTTANGKVTVREGSLTLPTYDYERAFVPTNTDDPIWPAPRLDFAQVGAPTPKSYRTLVLENDFLRLTILPELGGRIYRWEDKVSGRDILYFNSVVKPTHWGVRGWWLALGGIEWSFPLPDHGLYEYQSWRAETVADQSSAAVRLLQNGPDGLAVVITVGLNADGRFFGVTTELTNTGTGPLSTHFWNNAMLAPGRSNTVDPNSRLVWPADSLIVHGSAGTQSLPMDATLDWPTGSGEDLRSIANWPQHLSFFAVPAPRQGAVGLVDPDGDLAVIRTFPQRTAPGIKAFYGRELDPSLWTDGNDGRYFELWGGPSRDFDTPVNLQPGQSLRWTEQWYSVPGLGEFVAANAHVALALQPNGSETELRLASNGSLALQSMVTKLVVRVDDQVIFDAPVSLSAQSLFRQTLPHRFDGRRWVVQLIDGQNRVIFAYDNRGEATDVAPIEESIEWDARLDELNVDVIPADVRPGQSYWKVTKAEFQTPEEGGGRHHIYIEVLDEAGDRIVGQEVQVHWQDGSAVVVTEDKPAPEYAANFPMYNALGGYSLTLPGLSDTVTGMGLPWGKVHVVYNVVFQRAVK
jgi:hypothetical protein